MKKAGKSVIFLMFLFAGCRTTVESRPAEQSQPTESSGTLVSPTVQRIPTSTPDRIIHGTAASPYCQLASQAASAGSLLGLSAFNLPPNQPASIHLDSARVTAKGLVQTDGTGRLSTNFAVPPNQPKGLYRVSVYAEGSFNPARCALWIWHESEPPRISASLTERLLSALDCNRQGVVQFSPDDQWAVIDCSVDGVTLIRLDGSKEWALSSDSLVGPHTDDFVNVSHWSADGAYAYIGANPHTDGFWEPFHQAAALFRLNLETGEIKEMLKGAYYSFAFSPDDRRLAYIQTAQSPVILRVRDLKTGTERATKFDSKYNTGGGYLWSADSQRLIFSIVQFDENNFEYEASSIVFWDRKKADVTIMEGYRQVLVPVEWIDQTRIVVQVLYDEDKNFSLDLITGELEQISP